MEKMADNKALMKQAQQYKTLGQAAEGLRAVIASGLAPAFDALTRGGVSILSSMMEGISKRFAILSNAFKGVGKAWGSAFSAIGKELDKLKAKGGLYPALKKHSSSGHSKVLGVERDPIERLKQTLPKAYLAAKRFVRGDACKNLLYGLSTFLTTGSLLYWFYQLRRQRDESIEKNE